MGAHDSTALSPLTSLAERGNDPAASPAQRAAYLIACAIVHHAGALDNQALAGISGLAIWAKYDTARASAWLGGVAAGEAPR